MAVLSVRWSGAGGCVGGARTGHAAAPAPEPVQETVGEGKPCYVVSLPVRLGDFHTTENRGGFRVFQSDSGNHFHSTFVNRASGSEVRKVSVDEVAVRWGDTVETGR